VYNSGPTNNLERSPDSTVAAYGVSQSTKPRPINVMGPEIVLQFQEVINALEADEHVRVRGVWTAQSTTTP